MITEAEICEAIACLRDAVAGRASATTAAAIAAASRDDRATAEAIAQRRGWSPDLVAESIHNLCEPFTDVATLAAIAEQLPTRREVAGFVMPGNIPGAGLHELVLTLLSGAAAVVKTASAEPTFFASWAARLARLDPSLGARLAVFNWSRDRDDLTRSVRDACDRLIVLGDDATIDRLSDRSGDRQIAEKCPNHNYFISFGDRYSGAVVTAAATAGSTVRAIARDVALFEQRGCLSPHHIFVADPADAIARDFAARLAASLCELGGGPLPPPSRLDLVDAAAIRSCRERARWRAIGGSETALWEGPMPGWTVIYERDAVFTHSPGFRTIFVSPFADSGDLARRLRPVAGRVEAFALGADPHSDDPGEVARIKAVLEQAGATYICAPGRMQSPPLDWPHGGGVVLRALGLR